MRISPIGYLMSTLLFTVLGLVLGLGIAKLSQDAKRGHAQVQTADKHIKVHLLDPMGREIQVIELKESDYSPAYHGLSTRFGKIYWMGSYVVEDVP